MISNSEHLVEVFQTVRRFVERYPLPPRLAGDDVEEAASRTILFMVKNPNSKKDLFSIFTMFRRRVRSERLYG